MTLLLVALVILLTIKWPARIVIRRVPSATHQTPAETVRPASVTTQRASVIRALAADRIEVRLESGAVERVHLIGLQTPAPGKTISQQATMYTKNSLPTGRTIALEVDAEERDSEGQLLAYVWLFPPVTANESEIRSNMLNARLLLAGYAVLSPNPLNSKYAEMLASCEKSARRRSLTTDAAS